jgi:hypothetical protein
MTRMTKSLSLVLIGSSLLLAGCSAPPPPPNPRQARGPVDKDGWVDDPEKEKEGQRQGHTTTSHGHRTYGHGVFVSPSTPRASGFHAPAPPPPAGRPSTSGSHAGASSRPGGFGSTGHSVSS